MLCLMDSLVNPESTARLIDAFVNSLDLKDYDMKEAFPLIQPQALWSS